MLLTQLAIQTSALPVVAGIHAGAVRHSLCPRTRSPLLSDKYTHKHTHTHIVAHAFWSKHTLTTTVAKPTNAVIVSLSLAFPFLFSYFACRLLPSFLFPTFWRFVCVYVRCCPFLSLTGCVYSINTTVSHSVLCVCRCRLRHSIKQEARVVCRWLNLLLHQLPGSKASFLWTDAFSFHYIHT